MVNIQYLFSKNNQLLILIILVGTLLRLYHLGSRSLWMDEIGQVVVASHSWQELFYLVRLHVSPPLDYMLTKLVLYLGREDWLVRMPAVLFGIGSLPLMFILSRKIADEKTALLATAMLALSPLAINHAQEARMYSLFLLLALLSCWLTLEYLEKPSWQKALLWGTVNGILVLTHYFGVLLVAAVSLLLVLSGKRANFSLKNYLNIPLGWMATLVLFTPWIPHFLWQIRYRRGEIWYALKPGGDFFRSVLNNFSINYNTHFEWYWIILFFGLFLAGWVAAINGKKRKLIVLCSCWLGILLVLNAFSFWKKLVTPRNLLPLLPLYYIACSEGLRAILHILKLRSIYMGLVIVAVLMAWPVYGYHFLPPLSYKPDWKGAAQYIRSRLQPGEHVLTIDNYNRGSLAYYLEPDAENVYMRKSWTDMRNDSAWITWNADCIDPQAIVSGKIKGWFLLPTGYIAGENMGWSQQELKYHLQEPVVGFATQGRKMKIYRIN